jgi:AraC-like DNA-binding protein
MEAIRNRQFIREHLRERGTIASLADAIGCSRITLFRWFAGSRNLSPSILARMREELPEVPAEVWLEAIFEEGGR